MGGKSKRVLVDEKSRGLYNWAAVSGSGWNDVVPVWINCGGVIADE
jgi:hypothetical protein